jgi:molybdopterin-guanine dinucleotide biosynthesis protein A
MTGAEADPAYPREHIAGLILAGGAARRMGGVNKALIILGGKQLIEIAADNLATQCGQLLISANEPEAFRDPPWPLISDLDDTRAGPMAGVLAAMEWCAANRPGIEWLLSAPVDCPFLPSDLGWRLWNTAVLANKPVALAASGGRTHFVCGLWSMSQRETIHRQLVDEGIRRAESIADVCGYATAEWPALPRDPFFNINTPDDLRVADRTQDGSSNDFP